jgi:hypothetical protein
MSLSIRSSLCGKSATRSVTRVLLPGVSQASVPRGSSLTLREAPNDAEEKPSLTVGYCPGGMTKGRGGMIRRGLCYVRYFLISLGCLPWPA